jgi:hypothetical protein
VYWSHVAGDVVLARNTWMKTVPTEGMGTKLLTPPGVTLVGSPAGEGPA